MTPDAVKRRGAVGRLAVRAVGRGLGMRDRVELVRYAIRRGLVEP